MIRRTASMFIVIATTVAATVFACGGDDGGGGTGKIDAGAMIDANAMIDAPGSGSNVTGLGQTCTPPAQGSGQGDCPDGHICLVTQGSTVPSCTKPCTTGAGDQCAVGYTGPGVASCILQVSFDMQDPVTFCGITCAGDGVNGCTAQTCTGQCPGQLMCNADIVDGSGNSVGSACN